MQRRELLALAATVGAATVAGCLGSSGGDDSAVDGQSLGESHREALAAAGRYAVTYDERGESAGSDPLTLTAELIVDETTERYLRTNTDSLGVSLSQQYVDSGQVYSYTDGGITNVESYDVAALDDGTRRSIMIHLDFVTTLIETVPGRTQFQEVGTESFDGVTVTRYEAEGDSVVERSVDEVRYVMLIDGDGLVRYFERHTEDGTGDEQRIVTRRWHFHDIGTAEIREPDWVGELR